MHVVILNEKIKSRSSHPNFNIKKMYVLKSGINKLNQLSTAPGGKKPLHVSHDLCCQVKIKDT